MPEVLQFVREHLISGDEDLILGRAAEDRMSRFWRAGNPSNGWPPAETSFVLVFPWFKRRARADDHELLHLPLGAKYSIRRKHHRRLPTARHGEVRGKWDPSKTGSSQRLIAF